MHMWFRTVLHAWISRFGRKLGHYDVARTRLRVVPTDLDFLRHVNNGVYFSLFDIGRFDLLRRSGVWRLFLDRGWYAVVAAETITFRKSLTLWQRFTVESRIIGYDDKAVYMQHRAVVNGEIYAEAFIRARILRRTGGSVPHSELLDAVGAAPASFALPEWLHGWADDVALPSPRAAAPSVWE
jgi:acyl-CoA thioesterase FadM